jgi:hypothetical protein
LDQRASCTETREMYNAIHVDGSIIRRRHADISHACQLDSWRLYQLFVRPSPRMCNWLIGPCRYHRGGVIRTTLLLKSSNEGQNKEIPRKIMY